MTNFYTLISYLEGTSGYIDRCGDFVSGEDSEIFIQTYHYSRLDDFINDYAQQKLLSDKSNREITILLDGVDTYNFPLSDEDKDFSALEKERDELEDKVYSKYMELVQIQKQKEEDAKQKALQLKMAQERIYQKRVEDEELKQLEKLQAKYGIRI